MEEEITDYISPFGNVIKTKNGQYLYATTTTNGMITIVMNEPEIVRGGMEIETTVEFYVPGLEAKTFVARWNPISLSSRETICRSLGRVLDKETPWEQIFSEVVVALRSKQDNEDNSCPMEDAPEEVDTPLLGPYLEHSGVNILFGMGGTAKTYISLKMALAVIGHGDFLGIKPEKSGKVLFIDYEASFSTINHRLKQLAGGEFPPNMIRYLSPKGSPIHEMRKTVKRMVQKNEISLIIIDSAALACGGRPEEAETATRFFNALAEIGVTVLLIAHEAKGSEGKYPFGSIFFWNCARRIWNVQATQEQEDRLLEVGLMHRKANNGRLEQPVGIRVWFGDDKVDISKGELNTEWSGERTIKNRIFYALVKGPKHLDELREEMNDVKDAVLKKSLSQMKDKGKLDNFEHLWILKKKTEYPKNTAPPLPVAVTGNTTQLPGVTTDINGALNPLD